MSCWVNDISIIVIVFSDVGSSFETFRNLCQLSQCQGVIGKMQ